MSDLFDRISESDRAKLRRRPQPNRLDPMLATLTDDHFSDPDWIYERKLDGVRCLVFREGGRVHLRSRNQRSMNETWPELVDALEADGGLDLVADGEIVAFDGAVSSFSRLQSRIGLRKAEDARSASVAVYLYLFDLLHVDGHDTTQLPNRTRKALLKRALSFSNRVRFTPHRNERGEAYLKEACEKGWEGLIAKDSAAPYVHGRSRSWLKFKCVAGQELVIGGYTEPRGARERFGALLVGYYEDGALRYAGKVGTGFDDATLDALGRRFERLERKTSPFEDDVSGDGLHFVRPELVGEFGFTEWTKAGRLRHPRFLGLRTDKSARDVTRERASR